MATGMEVAVRNQMHRNLGSGLETMSRLVRSLVGDDQELLRIQASNSWSNLDKVSTQLHSMQASNERIQQVLAVYMKWAKDDTTAIKKEIATLYSFVSISSDEQTELAEQEKQTNQLLEKCHEDLKEAEKQLRSKTSQNWRIARVLTNALANTEIEAKKAFRMMAQFTKEHTSRHVITTERRQESQQAIALARSNYDKFELELCEKLEELSQFQIFFQSEKHQAEELRAMTEVLDPVTIYCHVLCELCQNLPPDPMIIIHPVLQELRESLDRCLTPEAQELYTVQRERENLQTLYATVESLEQPKTILTLGFEDCTFSDDLVTEFSDHLCIIDGCDESYFTGSETDLAFAIDMDLDPSSSGASSSHVLGATSWGESGTVSCDLSPDLSRDSNSDDRLVAPEPQQMQNIQVGIQGSKQCNTRDKWRELLDH